MAFKLKEGETYSCKGVEFPEARGLVKTVILDREAKTANLIFKIYANDLKIFELENNNILVKNYEKTLEDGTTETVKDYDNYFETMNGSGHSAMTLLKIWAYRYIIDKQLNIGNFVFENWQSDEVL